MGRISRTDEVRAEGFKALGVAVPPATGDYFVPLADYVKALPPGDPDLARERVGRPTPTRTSRRPSAGQNPRVPVFGALEAMTGEVSAMITAKKRSGEFLAFLQWLLPATWTENCYPLLNHACFPYTATRKRRI